MSPGHHHNRAPRRTAMRQLGKGAYGVVVTDGKLAYKTLLHDASQQHYERAWRALCALQGSGIGDDHRPGMVWGPSGVYTPGFIMPVYSATIKDIPLSTVERAVMPAWLTETVFALHARGVLYRDFSLGNVARRVGSNHLVLIDLDSCVLVADAEQQPVECGSFCPFYSYPGLALPRADVHLTNRREILIMCMWFAAQALLNVTTKNVPASFYYHTARPTYFYGVAWVAKRVAKELRNGITPDYVVDGAIVTLQSVEYTAMRQPWAFRTDAVF